MNAFTMTGNVARKNYLEGTGNKMSLLYVTIAETTRRKTDDGKRIYNYVECKAFGKTAEFINKYFDEGKAILIEGSVVNEARIGKDGEKTYRQSVVIRNAEFMLGDWGGRSSTPAPETEDDGPMTEDPGDGFMDIPDELDDDDLPFE